VTRTLSELEGCVLGHLWKHGPTTAYAVRKELLNSPSSHWSGSAGAIYPLLERLENQKLVASREGARGDRSHWAYELTETGRKALVAWLAPSLAGDIVSIAPDPLRTRVYFLGALPPRQRAAFLADARTKLLAHIKDIEAMPAADEYDALAIRGAIRAARARIAWLDDVRKSLARPKAPRRRQQRALR
jgi:DNA-binding PadR family transcriptional regulator